MNPLATRWMRLSVLLLIAVPVVAFAVSITSDVDYVLALLITLYVWVGVCGILALIAFAGVLMRLLGRGMRAIRR
jgi:hypothetical protein